MRPGFRGTLLIDGCCVQLSFQVCVPNQIPAQGLIAAMTAETAVVLGGENGMLGDQFAGGRVGGGGWVFISAVVEVLSS